MINETASFLKNIYCDILTKVDSKGSQEYRVQYDQIKLEALSLNCNIKALARLLYTTAWGSE